MHVVMLLSNAFRPDPRVERESQSLAQSGHRVTVICWDRRAELPERESHADVQVMRIHSVRSAYGSGWRQLLYLPRFWKSAVGTTAKMRPDVIHCHDLDTLPAGWWLKRRVKARLVYDAHEDYPAVMSLYLPRYLVSLLSWLERRLLGRVDVTLTASTVFAEKLQARGIAPVTTIGNFQLLQPFDRVSEADVGEARARLGFAPDDVLVAYLGGFSRDRQLLPLIEAAQGLHAMQVILWGAGHQETAVSAAAADVPNVHYLGWAPASDVPLLFKMVDIVYYCLVPNYPGAAYNAPNTLSNAMAAGRPILANDLGDLGRIVRETGCGILIPDTEPATIRRGLAELCDPKVRRRLGEAGRAAAERKYSWEMAEKQLMQVYAQVTQEA